jgi:hypothetical protein
VLIVAGILAVGCLTVVGLTLVAARRADRIKAQYGRLVGSPASALSRGFRAPDSVERVAPIVYDNATGSITARYQPYIVWTYDVSTTLGLSLRVLIDDRTEKITRFKGPFD